MHRGIVWRRRVRTRVNMLFDPCNGLACFNDESFACLD